MEILNNNQRRSARWRLFFIGLAVIGMTTASVAAIHSAYAGGGADDLEQCQMKLLEQEQIWKSRNQDLKNENKALKKRVKDMESSGKKPNEEMKILKDKMELKDERIKALQEDLARCNAKLSEF